MKKNKYILVLIVIFCSSTIDAQNVYPKNIDKAVKILQKCLSDSINQEIINIEDARIKSISYHWDGKFDYIYNWTNEENEKSKLDDYLINKGIIYHQTEVVLLCYKSQLLNKGFDELEIIKPFQLIEQKWEQEDLIRFESDSLRGHYIPIDLNDAVVHLDRMWTDSAKAQIIKLSESEFSGRVHLNMGMKIRNGWQLWGGSRLSKYFNDLGINHPDDMSGIIFDSYYRYLKDIDINLETQVKYYEIFWIESDLKQKESEAKEREVAIANIDLLKKGDTLEYNYNFEFADEEQENLWYEDECIAIGKLLEVDTDKLRIKVEVIESCSRKGIVVYDNINTRIYNEENNKWEKPKKRRKIYLKKRKSKWFDHDDWHVYY